MSEIDRLSHSGLYPALPVSDQRSKGGSSGRQPPKSGDGDAKPSETEVGSDTPRQPKSLVDEYA
jgi:hypothetical protein